jgi:hypothetical protein
MGGDAAGGALRGQAAGRHPGNARPSVGLGMRGIGPGCTIVAMITPARRTAAHADRCRAAARLWPALCACAWAAGCATPAPPGGASHTPGADAPLLVVSRGLGVVGSDTGWTVGWLSETKLYARFGADDCRVIVVLHDPRLLDALRAWLQAAGSDLDRVCVGVEGDSR